LTDPYSDVINPHFGWARYNVVGDGKFDWKNDNAPRMAPDRKNWIIYEMHVGSIFGAAQNVQRSTFKDVQDHLQYLKDLGVNTLELLPTDPFEGMRDWGYMGTESLGVANQYGFEDKDGHWVNGREALCRLIDAAHGMGFNVVTDLVYNHWGGDANDMWNVDGSKNPYYNWDPSAPQAVLKPGPFGDLPAYNNPAVRQFIIDSAQERIDDLHFDGERFDFTHPIHDPNGGGGLDGWTLLRRINRQLHFFHPTVETNAEEFPNSEIITDPAESNLQGGAGFNTMWNTEFNHRLIHGNGDPSVLEQAVAGQQTNMDREMAEITNPPGFRSPDNAITIITDHDEVGNGAPIIQVADNYMEGGVPNQWQRDVTRTCFGVGMLSPGTPLFFQGTESNARNRFSWGIPSTWDLGWNWLHVGDNWNWNDAQFNDGTRQWLEGIADHPGSPDAAKLNHTQKQIVQYLRDAGPANRDKAEWDIYRKLQRNFVADAIALRQSSPAFDGDASVSRVYTHNDNSVMAFTRQKGNEQYLVIASLNHNNLPGYNIPLDGGQWHLVFNSDATQYGGDGWGSIVDTGGSATTKFDIPQGGLLVYKRVG
ncbi:MAG: alpha amylase C-terminal domain-containing protein, partial [Candidatus Xenobia bacterium]